MVALTTTMPSFSDPPDSFYPPQELPGPRLSAADPGARRQESPHTDELHSRDKAQELLNFSETFQTISGKDRYARSLRHGAVTHRSDKVIFDQTIYIPKKM